MTCTKCLYGANTSDQSVAIGGTVNLGTAVRYTGCGIGLDGGNLVIKGAGYYGIDASFTLVGTATDSVTVTVQLYKDGTPVTGAEASATVSSTISDVVNITAIIRETCCCESTITAVVTGGAVSVTNAAIRAIEV